MAFDSLIPFVCVDLLHEEQLFWGGFAKGGKSFPAPGFINSEFIASNFRAWPFASEELTQPASSAVALG